MSGIDSDDRLRGPTARPSDVMRVLFDSVAPVTRSRIAASLVSPDDLDAYATFRGWFPLATRSPHIRRYVSHSLGPELLMPADSDGHDYGEAVVRAIDTLSRVERRSVYDVLFDVLHPHPAHREPSAVEAVHAEPSSSSPPSPLVDGLGEKLLAVLEPLPNGIGGAMRILDAAASEIQRALAVSTKVNDVCVFFTRTERTMDVALDELFGDGNCNRFEAQQFLCMVSDGALYFQLFSAWLHSSNVYPAIFGELPGFANNESELATAVEGLADHPMFVRQLRHIAGCLVNRNFRVAVELSKGDR